MTLDRCYNDILKMFFPFRNGGFELARIRCRHKFMVPHVPRCRTGLGPPSAADRLEDAASAGIRSCLES